MVAGLFMSSKLFDDIVDLFGAAAVSPLFFKVPISTDY